MLLSPRQDFTPLASKAGSAVRLWRASLKCSGWSDLLSLLSEEELHRVERFSLPRDARRYVVSHAVLRTVLSGLTGNTPGSVTLGVEPDGKPILLGISRGLHFSLSRSEEYMLIGVAPHPVGVDLEWLAPPLDVASLAETIFSTREHGAFMLTPPEHRQNVLLSCWTQKEALLKASGKGLSIPPDLVEVFLTPVAATHHSTAIACLGARWQLNTVFPLPGYVGAVASPSP